MRDLPCRCLQPKCEEPIETEAKSSPRYPDVSYVFSVVLVPQLARQIYPLKWYVFQKVSKTRAHQSHEPNVPTAIAAFLVRLLGRNESGCIRLGNLRAKSGT